MSQMSGKRPAPTGRTCVTWAPVVVIASLFAGSAAAAVEFTSGTDEQARLPYWQISDGNMSLRLVQRLPDQTRGYFQARGFTAAQSETIAQACVFQTIFRNTAPPTAKSSQLSYDLGKWRTIYKGKSYPLKTREVWQAVWHKAGASQPAQVAFEWSLLPTQQQYSPGDYNWGMTLYGHAPGARFDLAVSWRQGNKAHRYTFKNIECARDLHPDPQEFSR